MSDHLGHEALLGHRFGLLEGDEAEAARRHLASCERCAAALARLEAAEEAMLPPEPDPPGASSLGERLRRSTAAPVAAMAVTWAAAALLPPDAPTAASLALLLAGGLAVVAWLHLVVAHAEAGFREVEACPAPREEDEEDRERLDAGVVLSLAQGLRSARARVTTVLVAAALLALAGAGSVLLASAIWPATTAEVLGERPTLLPLALSLGVLLGGVTWTGLRLGRLARQVSSWVRARATSLPSSG